MNTDSKATEGAMDRDAKLPDVFVPPPEVWVAFDEEWKSGKGPAYSKLSIGWRPEMNRYVPAATLSALQAELDAVRRERDTLRPWKLAIEEAGVVHWTLNAENENDPKRAINDLLWMSNVIALDPSASEDAAKLCDTHLAAKEAAERELDAVRHDLERHIAIASEALTAKEAAERELANWINRETYERTRRETAERELAGARAKYDELIMAVATKWPDESRHQTALRYITERERPKDNAARAAQIDAGDAGRIAPSGSKD